MNLSPMKAEWIVTRNCDMRCSYCNVPGSKVETAPFNRLTDTLDILKSLNCGLVVMYGGEITLLGYRLIDLIIHANTIDQPYAVITNGMRLLWDEPLRKDFCYHSKNLSVSIDSIEDIRNNARGTKSYYGWKLMELSDTKNIPDRVNCITVHKGNYKEVPDLIKACTQNNIWSILSIINKYKPGFRYSGKDDSLYFNTEDKKELEQLVEELLKMKYSNNYMMHDTPEVYKTWVKYGITQDWHCSRLTKLTIDADGRLLCCVDWKGGSNFNIFDLKNEDNHKRFITWFNKESKKCPGCCWSPLILLESYKSVEEGKLKLCHKENK